MTQYVLPLEIMCGPTAKNILISFCARGVLRNQSLPSAPKKLQKCLNYGWDLTLFISFPLFYFFLFSFSSFPLFSLFLCSNENPRWGGGAASPFATPPDYAPVLHLQLICALRTNIKGSMSIVADYGDGVRKKSPTHWPLIPPPPLSLLLFFVSLS